MANFDYVFFGSSSFSQVVLEELVCQSFQPKLVVVPQTKPSGRKQILQPSSLILFCQQHNLAYLEVTSFKNQTILEKLTQTNCKLAILASFGKIIPSPIISLFVQGIINVHPSLLPKWRGPSPLQAVLLAGEKLSGVTLIKLDNEVDHGPIIAQTKINLTLDETINELEIKSAKAAARLLVENLPKYLNQEIKLLPQDHTQATFCKIIKREDGQINWQQNAQTIYNQWRAYVSWPGIYTFWQKKRVKLSKISLSQEPAVSTGLVRYQNGKLLVDAQDMALEIKELQLAGGKALSAQNFILGHKNFISSKLG